MTERGLQYYNKLKIHSKKLIKTIDKLLSIVLAVALIVSCCTVALNVTAEDATAPVYYVSPTGKAENNGLSPEAPWGSINAVIAAVGDTYGEGDINGIAGLDIRDLVFANENIGTEDASIIFRADKNSDSALTADDIALIRKDLLG